MTSPEMGGTPEVPTLGGIIGQDDTVALLRRVLKTGRLPHSYLFHGPSGVGKWAAALAFSRALLCTEENTRERGDACGRCRSCRLVASASHPDLYRIGLYPKNEFPSATKPNEKIPPKPLDFDPAGTEMLTQVRIQQIRWLNTQSSHPPAEGSRRIFVIDPADRMNHHTQNAILKTLEEPESSSGIILVTTRPHALLPTIRSRCINVAMKTVDPIHLAEMLEQRGFEQKEARLRSSLSAGRPVTAETLDLAAMKERRSGFLADLAGLAESPGALADLPNMTGRILGEGQQDMLEGLDLLQALLRDLSLCKTGLPPERLLHTDIAEDLSGLAGRYRPEQLSELVRLIDRLRTDLRFNINKTLMAETILAELAKD